MDPATENNLRHNLTEVVELATCVAALRHLSKELSATEAAMYLDKLGDVGAALLLTDAAEVLATTVH